MKKYINKIILVIAFTTQCLLAFSQGIDTSQNAMVSFDHKGIVMILSADNEKKFNLFPEVNGFESAKIFRQNDSFYVVEIISNGKTLNKFLDRKSYQNIQTSVDAKIQEAISGNSAPAITNQKPAPAVIKNDGGSLNADPVNDGRIALLTASTTLSVFVYAPLLATFAGANSGSQYFGAVLLGGSAGFLIPFFATQNEKVTDGMSILATSGASMGMLHGLYVASLVSYEESSNAVANAMESFIPLTSIAEGVWGYYYARNRNLSYAQSRVMNSGNAYGTMAGTFLGAATSLNGSFDARPVFSLGVLGGVGGLVLGRYLGKKDDYTNGDASVADVTALGGFLAANAVYVRAGLFDNIDNIDKARGFLFIEAATSLGAYLFGDYMVQRKDFSGIDGSYLALTTAAGALAGAGLGLIATPDDAKNVFFISAAGASLSYFFYYRYMLGKHGYLNRGTKTSMNMGINPMTMVPTSNKGFSSPMLNLSLKF